MVTASAVRLNRSLLTFAGVALIACLAPLFAGTSELAAEEGVRRIALNPAATRVRYVARDRVAVWDDSGGGERTVRFLDPETGDVVLRLATDGPPVHVAPAADGSFYVLSLAPKGFGQVEIAKFAAAGENAFTLRFADAVRRPRMSIADGEDGAALVLSDATSSVVTVVANIDAMAAAGEPTISRVDFSANNVFLDEGPPSQTVVGRGEPFLGAYHSQSGLVSVTGILPTGKTFTRALGSRAGRASLAWLVPSLADVKPSQVLGLGGRSGLLIIDPAQSFLYLLAYDPQTRRPRDLVSIGFSATPPIPLGAEARARLDVANDLTALAYAVPGTRTLLVSKLEGNAFYGPYQPRGLPQISDVSLASDGKSLALLVSGGSELMLIDEPVAWARANDATPRDSDTETLQAQLAAFGFPVGFVDGRPGPQTATAVREFQRVSELPETGRFTAETLTKMEEAAAEFGPDHSCEALPEAERCATIDPTSDEAGGYAPRFCRADRDADRPIQVDYLVPGNKAEAEPEYRCSANHSCLYVSRINPLTYISLCTSP